jgi:hypothetical protein
MTAVVRGEDGGRRVDEDDKVDEDDEGKGEGEGEGENGLRSALLIGCRAALVVVRPLEAGARRDRGTDGGGGGDGAAAVAARVA